MQIAEHLNVILISKRLIFLAFMSFILAACSTTDSGRAQLTMKSDAQLELDAKRNFEMMRENLPLVQDRATIDYVACVANALVDVMDDDAAQMYWELAIFNQPVVNATVMPGGKISVYAGLLGMVENQHQLASVLGHEMAHATARHTNERATRAEISDVGIDIAALILGGGYYNRTQGIYSAMKSAEDLGLNKPFSRLHEAEADEIGLIYMARAGFDPRESVNLWKNMAAANQTKIPEMMSTHPSDESRLEAHISQLPEALVVYNQAKAEGREPDCQR
jgi:predicted Zn-dependent protease